MKSFIEYKSELNEALLNEKALNIGNKSASPRYNNILILAGGAGCFAGDTLVKTDKGHKPIQEIKIGDIVETLNEPTGEREWKPVEDIHLFQPTKQMVKLTLETGETIICSEDHEFYVDGKWVEAKDLSFQKEFIEYDGLLYDLSIKDNHNYVITKSDIIVHNSGKDFALSHIINFEGKRFDVDKLKEDLKKVKTVEDKFIEQTGRVLSDISFVNPYDVSVYHQFIKDNKYDDKSTLAFFMAQRGRDIKPNVIMNVTLKDLKKLKEISELAYLGGYTKDNIHICWIMNKFEIAYKQNQQRSRRVSDEVMISTHKGASQTMKELVEKSRIYNNYADGDYYILFNQVKVDSEVEKKNPGKFIKEPFYYIKRYEYIKIKDRLDFADISKIDQQIINKINSYVPQGAEW